MMTYKQERIAAEIAAANSPNEKREIWHRLVNQRLDAAREIEAVAAEHRIAGHISEYERCLHSARMLRRPHLA